MRLTSPFATASVPPTPQPPTLDELALDLALYSVNALPLRSCLNVSSLYELRDGKILAEMLCAASHHPEQRRSAPTRVNQGRALHACPPA